jgi:Kef-type K+ transport system membrane component KefB/mannitol/fructose-specific phosphotransferase system IIA component (Ntr-type)
MDIASASAWAASPMLAVMGWKLETHDPVLIFALVLAIVLIAPILLSRMGIPGLIGLIVAGLVVGPHGLGVFSRDSTFELLGSVGLLYLMFIAGLDVDLNQILRNKKDGILFGALTFILPQALGTLGAVHLLGYNWPTAILLASMLASHTLVSYPIVSQLGLGKERAVTTTIGGTILAVTAALLVLAVIARQVEGDGGASSWMGQALRLPLFVFAILYVLPRLASWFFRTVTASGEMEFIFVLTVAFFAAWLSRLAGVEPIIGAFLAGLALNRLIPDQSALMNRIHFVGNALFIPFFLLSVGMLINLRGWAAGAAGWPVAIFMSVMVVGTKWLAAFASGRLLKMSPAESWLMFGLSVNQAAATLAAVIIGFRIGLFDEAILNGAVLMILSSNLIGAMATEWSARKLALRNEAGPPAAPVTSERILIPLSNPETANPLVDLALMVRRKESSEPLYLVSVAQEGPDVDAQIAAGEKTLARAAVRATAAAVPVVPMTRIDLNIVDGIVRAIRERRISTVLIGWRGETSGWQHIFGNVLDLLIRQLRPMIITSRLAQPLNTIERVVLLLPPLLERHEGFDTVIRTIKHLAGQLGARLVVMTPPETIPLVTRRIQTPLPLVDVMFHGVPEMDEMPGQLKQMATRTDLVIFFSVRPHRLAWRPIFNRMPRLIHEAIPGVNLLILFPPNPRAAMEDAETGDGTLESPAAPLLDPSRTLCLPQAAGAPEVIRALLELAFAGRPDKQNELFYILENVLREYPVELMPGAVLIHAHPDGLSEKMVLTGILKQPVVIPMLGAPVKLLFVLLSPREQGPEQHLHILAALARLVQQPGLIDRLAGVQAPEELPEALSRWTPDSA